MVRYKDSKPIDVPSGAADQTSFYPWQPTSWPKPPEAFNEDFYNTVRIIFSETIIQEISNVIDDIRRSSPVGLVHRGHVIAIVLLCAIDTLASYAYSNISGRGATGKRYKEFIKTHFPSDYQPFAEDVYNLYRNSLIHSWNLFEATMYPDDRDISESNGTISFGLLNLFNALQYALHDFMSKLETDPSLQSNVLRRYKKLKSTAK
jgi:hypothetical protein